MPEGDTIRYAANRMRPALAGRVPEEIVTPQRRHAMDRWPARLAGRAVRAIDAHGKHLFLHFEGDLVLHSHLRMTGVWGTYERGRRWGRSPARAATPSGPGASTAAPGGRVPAAARGSASAARVTTTGARSGARDASDDDHPPGRAQGCKPDRAGQYPGLVRRSPGRRSGHDR